MIRFCAVLAVVVAFVAVAAGCSSSDGCATVCARSAACQPDGPGEAACNELCLEQSKDEAYADAIERQADCYDEGWNCGELAGGVCATPE